MHKNTSKISIWREALKKIFSLARSAEEIFLGLKKNDPKPPKNGRKIFFFKKNLKTHIFHKNAKKKNTQNPLYTPIWREAPKENFPWREALKKFFP